MVRSLAQETTVLHHIFGGYECMQNTCCECGGVSRSFAPFVQLSTDLEESGMASIEGALARHARLFASLSLTPPVTGDSILH